MVSPITQVNFTFALPGMLWIKREDGSRECVDHIALVEEVGEVEAARLNKVAYHNGMTGMWYNARNGGNVFVNGQEVNA